MTVEQQDTSKHNLQKAVEALRTIERVSREVLFEIDEAPLTDAQVSGDLQRLERALAIQTELEFALNALSEALDSGHGVAGSVSAVVDLWQQLQASRAPKEGAR
jgi:hypothetical protein